MKNRYMTVTIMQGIQDNGRDPKKALAIAPKLRKIMQAYQEQFRNPKAHLSGYLRESFEAARMELKNARETTSERSSVRVFSFTYERKGLTKTFRVHVPVGVPLMDYRDELNGAKANIRAYVQSLREQRRTMDISRDSYRLPDGEHVSYSCAEGVHTKPGVFLEILKLKKSGAVFTYKAPQTKSEHVGIEIEFYSKAERSTLAASLVDAGLGDSVCLKDDGSIQPPSGFHAHEITIIAPVTQIKTVVNKALAVVNAHESAVNSSCGLHVHLDMRELLASNDREKLETIHGNLVVSHRLLINMLPPSRRHNRYCRLNATRKIKWSNRYFMVNGSSLQKHKTIEIRSHSSTLNADKIMNWVRILRKVVRAEPMQRVPKSVESFAKRLKLPARLVSYIKGRIARFGGEDAATQTEDSQEAVAVNF